MVTRMANMRHALLFAFGVAISGCAHFPTGAGLPGPEAAIADDPANVTRSVMKRLQSSIAARVAVTGSCKIEVDNVPNPKTGTREINLECVGDDRYDQQILDALRDVDDHNIPRYRTMVWSPGWRGVLSWDKQIGRRMTVMLDPRLTTDLPLATPPGDRKTISRQDFETLSAVAPDLAKAVDKRATEDVAQKLSAMMDGLKQGDFATASAAAPIHPETGASPAPTPLPASAPAPVAIVAAAKNATPTPPIEAVIAPPPAPASIEPATQTSSPDTTPALADQTAVSAAVAAAPPVVPPTIALSPAPPISDEPAVATAAPAPSTTTQASAAVTVSMPTAPVAVATVRVPKPEPVAMTGAYQSAKQAPKTTANIADVELPATATVTPASDSVPGIAAPPAPNPAPVISVISDAPAPGPKTETPFVPYVEKSTNPGTPGFVASGSLDHAKDFRSDLRAGRAEQFRARAPVPLSAPRVAPQNQEAIEAPAPVTTVPDGTDNGAFKVMFLDDPSKSFVLPQDSDAKTNASPVTKESPAPVPVALAPLETAHAVSTPAETTHGSSSPETTPTIEPHPDVIVRGNPSETMAAAQVQTLITPVPQDAQPPATRVETPAVTSLPEATALPGVSGEEVAPANPPETVSVSQERAAISPVAHTAPPAPPAPVYTADDFGRVHDFEPANGGPHRWYIVIGYSNDPATPATADQYDMTYVLQGQMSTPAPAGRYLILSHPFNNRAQAESGLAQIRQRTPDMRVASHVEVLAYLGM